MEKPNCRDCKHYFVTWNQRTPNGCRRYGIESKENPSVIVHSAGMGDCQGYEAKRSKELKKTPLDLNSKDLW